MQHRPLLFYLLLIVLLGIDILLHLFVENFTYSPWHWLVTTLALSLPRWLCFFIFIRYLQQQRREVLTGYGMLVFADISFFVWEVAAYPMAQPREATLWNAFGVIVAHHLITALLIGQTFASKAAQEVISSAHDARNKAKLLEEIVNNSSMGVSVFSPPHRFLYMNDITYDIIGLNAIAPYHANIDIEKTVAASDIAIDIYAIYQSLWNEAVENDANNKTSLCTEPNAKYSKEFCGSDGTIWQLDYMLLQHNQPQHPAQPYLLLLSRDTTERTKLIQDLQEANRVAEANNRVKDTFLANVSHELRTPLTSILGFGQILSEDPHIQQDADASEMVDIVNRNSNDLLYLVNDILDLSKAQANRLTFMEDDVNTRVLLNSEISRFRFMLRDKGLRVRVGVSPDVPETLCYDGQKISQIVRNLLSNAIKFTTQGGITMHCWSSDIIHLPKDKEPSEAKALALFKHHYAVAARYPSTDKERIVVHIEVQDTGVGIAPEELQNIFEPFIQSSSGIQSKQGTGLGLTICKRFATFLGGDLTITSTVGRGSRCHLWFLAKYIHR